MQYAAYIVALILLWAPLVGAATYYVDPATGDNTQDGTSSSTPWLNPPGTRTADDSGFWSATWEAGASDITTSNKITCGDTILLKGGSTQTSTEGGSWLIADGNGPTPPGSGYYDTECHDSSAITIRVATSGEWTGSSGNFTINGTGVIATCLGNCETPPDDNDGSDGLVLIQDIENLTIGGNSATQRFMARDADDGESDKASGILATRSSGGTCGSCGAKLRKFRAQWLELVANDQNGISVSYADNWVVTDSISYDNMDRGFDTGDGSDNHVTHGAFVRCTAYNNGLAEVCEGSGDAFMFLGVEDLWIIDAESYENHCLGFNSGNSWAPKVTANWVTRIRDGEFWDNGVAVVEASGRAAITQSGDSDQDFPYVILIIQGATTYRNPVRGGLWFPHDAGIVHAWHMTLFNDGYTGGGGSITYERTAEASSVYNSLIVSGGVPWSHNKAGAIYDNIPTTDYNLVDFRSSASETFSSFWYDGATWTEESKTFTEAAAGDHGFLGANELISYGAVDGVTDYDPGFTDIGGNCDQSPWTYEDCDFTLQATSDAVDAGTTYFTANAAGESSQTLYLNTPSNILDASWVFIEDDSFLDAVADTIRVGSCTAVISDIPAPTTILLATACDWADGDGVHLASSWSGTAPDIGANEYVSGATTTTSSSSTSSTSTSTSVSTTSTSTSSSTSTTATTIISPALTQGVEFSGGMTVN